MKHQQISVLEIKLDVCNVFNAQHVFTRMELHQTFTTVLFLFLLQTLHRHLHPFLYPHLLDIFELHFLNSLRDLLQWLLCKHLQGLLLDKNMSVILSTLKTGSFDTPHQIFFSRALLIILEFLQRMLSSYNMVHQQYFKTLLHQQLHLFNILHKTTLPSVIQNILLLHLQQLVVNSTTVMKITNGNKNRVIEHLQEQTVLSKQLTLL